MSLLPRSYMMKIFRSLGGSRRACCVMWVGLSAGIVSAPPPAQAQDTTIYITLPDAAVHPGDLIFLPISLTNMRDTIEAYSLTFTLSRPGLVEFPDSVTIDSTPLCLDPPLCTIWGWNVDTTTAPVQLAAGTLTADWDLLNGYFLAPATPTFRGFSDIDLDNLPLGIPPLTLGEDLLVIVARALCDPDTMSGFTVGIQPAGLPEFSTPLGSLILPVAATGATIVILPTAPGDLDHSGVFDVLDVVRIVNCAFRSDCPGCTNDLADLDCNGVVNVLDVIGLVNHVFRGGPVPGCTLE